MFKKLFKPKKPRVYLGILAVALRADFKKNSDQWGLLKSEDLDTGMQQSLKEIFSLPSAQDTNEPTDTDLVLDVIVPKFQSGDFLDISLGDIAFPVFWRPVITVSSRLYYLKSGKTKATFSVTEKLKWRQYFGRVFSWRSLCRFKPLFDKRDMDLLLYQACHKLLLKMQNDLS